MAEVDFSDRKASIAWFEGQSPEVRSAITSRAALRVLANIGLIPPENRKGLDLTVLRATLTSAVRGSGRTADVDLLQKAANSAANTAADSVARSALSWDAAQNDITRFRFPLWAGADIPPAIARNHADYVAWLAGDPVWAFWHDWYLAMWEGRFEDWVLADKVALIPDEVWEEGAAAVAAEIRRIEEDHADASAPLPVTPESVPKSSVSPLFNRAPIVQASMATLSETVNLRIDAFSRLTLPNERISFFDTLSSLPETANRIADIVSKGPSNEGEIALALEVGTLRAQVTRLQADLEKALAELESIREKSWYKKSSVLVAGTLVSAVSAGIWALSGDDKLLEDRWNKLSVDLTFLVSRLWPDPEDRILDDLRFELPDVDEA